ncbi:unnamed protein product [Heligmosomoides polygyrus]|uniref:Carn_acyltransf domain-containing protein n=1 Tax=Heligmosomoides polygyrus TaxID=6339 RepID=A0A183GMC0_HELPZ|nr:unnamed protein product [Heligmosomoides polygyrus]
MSVTTATFSKQDELPSLPVPDLNETLDKYLKAALVLLDANQRKKTVEAVEVFRCSTLAKTLQSALINRGGQMRNWLEDWWYDVYNEVRLPLIPYLSVAAGNSLWKPLDGSQLHRAADRNAADHTESRNHVGHVPVSLPFQLLSRARHPEGSHHSILQDRGNVWKVDMLRDGKLKSQDELYHALRHIDDHSKVEKYSVASLTTEHRDTWAKVSSVACQRVGTEYNSFIFLTRSSRSAQQKHSMILGFL